MIERQKKTLFNQAVTPHYIYLSFHQRKRRKVNFDRICLLLSPLVGTFRRFRNNLEFKVIQLYQADLEAEKYDRER